MIKGAPTESRWVRTAPRRSLPRLGVAVALFVVMMVV
jgi:hypothetical protein